MAATNGTEMVGQTIPALLSYVDSNGNPVGGLNVAAVTWELNHPELVSFAFDSGSGNWKFTGLATGVTNVIATDPTSNFSVNGSLTITPAAGQPAGLSLAWGPPV